MLDPQTIKSRQIVADYKKYNANTIEVVSERPNAKTWIFKRVQTDENAYNFAANQKKESEATKRNKRLKKESSAYVAKVKPEKEKLEKPKAFKYGTMTVEIFKLYDAGKTPAEIGEILNIPSRRASVHISKRKLDMGMERNVQGATYKKAVELFKQRKTNTEIGNILNIKAHTAGYHRKNYLNESES